MYVKMTVSQEESFHVILFSVLRDYNPFYHCAELQWLSPNKTGKVYVTTLCEAWNVETAMNTVVFLSGISSCES